MSKTVSKVSTGAANLVVYRDGAPVSVPKGEAFDFTEEELVDFDRAAEARGDEPYYRDAVDETAASKKKSKNADL